MYTFGGKTTGKAAMYSQRRACFSSRDPKDDPHRPWAAVGSWFLGPKAENYELFRQQAIKGIDGHIQFRKSFFPCDPAYVTDEIIESQTYRKSVIQLKQELANMATELQNSVPFFSTRYKVSYTNN